MKNLIQKFIIVIMGSLLFSININSITYDFNDTWGPVGISVITETPNSIRLNMSLHEVTLEDVNIDGITMKNIISPALYGPSNPGVPNFPKHSCLVAIPEGAQIQIQVINFKSITIDNCIPAPAKLVEYDPYNETFSCSDTIDSTIYYNSGYNPQLIIQTKEQFEIRGVDVAPIVVIPFQYNVSTQQTTVYTDIVFQVNFIGGSGHFGEDRLRSRFWDEILKTQIVNFTSLPSVDYTQRIIDYNQAKDLGYPYGAEFVILIPNDDIFKPWADSIKRFRQEQGILTEVFQLKEINCYSFEQIDNWIENAYLTWNIPPEAILILSDYGPSGGGSYITSKIHLITHTIYTQFASDYNYSDVDDNTIPDIVIGRISAQNEYDLRNIIMKNLDYERNPPDEEDFYSNTVLSGCYQENIVIDTTYTPYDTTYLSYYYGFHVGLEILNGFFHKLGKCTTRLYATHWTSWNPLVQLQVGDPWLPMGSFWTPGGVEYFSHLGYISETVDVSFLDPNIWFKTGQDINNSINAGSFLVFNIGHGMADHWSQPYYDETHIYTVNNGNNQYPLIYSNGCWTGKFDDVEKNHSELFVSAFRYKGPLGIIAASHQWGDCGQHLSGIMDYIWPSFDPLYPVFQENPGNQNEILPAFALAAGKIYNENRFANWIRKYNETLCGYYVFHYFNDPYQRLFTDTPQELLISNLNDTITAGSNFYSAQIPNNSFITLSVDGNIIGRKAGDGNFISIPIVPQPAGTQIKVVITKQNYLIYSDIISVNSTEEACVRFIEMDTIVGGNNNGQLNPNKFYTIKIKVSNFGTQTAYNPSFCLTSSDTNIIVLPTMNNIRSIDPNDTIILNFPVFLKKNLQDQTCIALNFHYSQGNGTFSDEQLKLYVNSCDILFEFQNIHYITGNMTNLGSGVLFGPIQIFALSSTPYFKFIDSLETLNISVLNVNESIHINNWFTYELLNSDTFIYDTTVNIDLMLSSNCGNQYFFSSIYKLSLQRFLFENFEYEVPRWIFSDTLSWRFSTGNNAHNGFKSMYNGLLINQYNNNVTNSRVRTFHQFIIPSIGFKRLIISFWQKYDLEESYDGVQIQATTDNGNSWITLHPITGYTGISLGYGGFFSGESIYTGEHNTWHEQKIYIDSIYYPDLYNKSFKICWRFGSNDNIAKQGYYFDDLSIYSYQIISGDEECIRYAEFTDSSKIECNIFCLFSLFPNIIKSDAIINYSIPFSGQVDLAVYDITGRRVVALVNDFQTSGVHQAEWNLNDESGELVPNGTYFYRLSSGNYDDIKKLIIMR